MGFRLSTMGETLLAIGAVIFLANVLLAILSYYRAIAKTTFADATALQPTEVKP